MRAMVWLAAGAIALALSNVAFGQQLQPQPKMRLPPPEVLNLAKFNPGSVRVCLNRVNIREENGLTILSGSGRDPAGVDVTFYFNASGGKLVINSSNALFPPTSSGWSVGNASDIVRVLTETAAAQTQMIFEFAGSPTPEQPITGLQVNYVGAKC